MNEAITPAVLQAVFGQHRLGPESIHGPSHWARVLEIGRRLAPLTGARPDVVELFAVLHDSQRTGDGIDLVHGPRAAFWLKRNRSLLPDLDEAGFQLLVTAIRDHTMGFTKGDPTLLTCWDSDRLDLGRAGIWPEPGRLCTGAARQPEMLEWANQRSLAHFFPPELKQAWGY